jgi:Ca2+-binding RTX toxin-like protein
MVLAVPAAASAQAASTTNPGTVTMTIVGLEYAARPGQANDVTVTLRRNAMVVRDAAAALTVGSGCRPGADFHEVVCGRDTAGMAAWMAGRYTIALGDGDDVAHVVDDSAAATAIIGGVIPSATLEGGPGNDELHGGPGQDTLVGGPGADVLDGGDGPFDEADYSDHTTSVTADIGDGADDGSAGEGDDVQSTVEWIRGGDGDDTLTGDDADNWLRGGPGADTLHGGAGDDQLIGGFEPYTDLQSYIVPLDGADHLFGDGGRDTLIGGIRGDDLHGGYGRDTVSYADHGGGFFYPGETAVPVQPVVAAIGGTSEGNGEDGPAGARDTIAADVENLIGSSQNDTLTGDAGANRLDGGGSADTLRGGDGADTLTGGMDTAADTLLGEAGDDVAVAGIAYGPTGVAGPDGGDTFDGGGGADRIDYGDRQAPVTVTLGNALADDGAAGEKDKLLNVENATGGWVADQLSGSDGSNVLKGGYGDAADVLRGLGGDDRLYGGISEYSYSDGVDQFDAGDGDDVVEALDQVADAPIVCGPGSDVVHGDGPTYPGGPAPAIDPADASCETLGTPGEHAAGTHRATTDTDGVDGVNAADPIDTEIVADDPAAAVAVDENDLDGRSAGAFTNLGQQVTTTVTGGGAATVTMTIDASIAPDGGAGELVRNGSPLAPCPDTGPIMSDGCIASSTRLPDGDLRVTVPLGYHSAGPIMWTWRVPTAGLVSLDSSGSLFYNARDGERNDVTATLDGTTATLSDAGTTQLVPGRGCVSTAATEVRCTVEPGSELWGYTIALGDQDDVVHVVGDAAGTLLGGDGGDELHGGDGPDILSGDAGADVLDGGDGRDGVSYADRAADAPVTVTIGDGANDGGAVDGAGDDVQASVENLMGGAGDDTVTATAAANDLVGGGGNDTLRGGGGSDALYGDAGSIGGSLPSSAGTGDDTLDGGDGGDTLIGGAGGDELAGGPGRDTVSYEDHAWPYGPSVGTDGVDVTVGDAGRDDGSAADGVPGARDHVAADVERITGTWAADTLTGDDGANVLDGGMGADTIRGGAGPDTLLDGGGDDTLDGGDGDDTWLVVRNLYGPTDGADAFSGGAGEDIADYSTRQAPVTVTLDGTADDGAAGEGDDVRADVEDVTGGTGSDRIVGNAAANHLSGGPDSGADTIDGGDGDDVLSGGDGWSSDGTIGDGRDTLSGGDGQDVVRALDGAVDTVDCGPALDVAETDVAVSAKDATSGCENVNPQTIVQGVQPGETAGTLTPPTATSPVATAITSPNAGNVTIQESVVTQAVQPPAGTDLLNLQMNITAPDASVEDPLALTFTVHSSLVPAGGAGNITVYRNGVAVAGACDPAAPGDPTQNASPDPCVSARQTDAQGNVKITVLSSHASEWNFAVPHRTVAPPAPRPSPAPAPAPAAPTPAAPAPTAPAPAGDTAAPKVTLGAVKAPKLGAAVKTGVAVAVTVSEGGSVKVQLLLDAKTAKKLKLPAVVGTGSAKAAAAGKVKVAAKLSAKAKAKLRGQRKVALTVKVTVTDAAGNAATSTRKVTLKR